MLDGFDEAVGAAGDGFKAVPQSGAGLVMQGIDNGTFVFPKSVNNVSSSTKMLWVP